MTTKTDILFSRRLILRIKLHHVTSSHDRAENKDLMCITPRNEVDLFECSISEGDMAQEDTLELITDDDDNIIDIEG